MTPVETIEIRKRRLHMRSIRRGIKEMDLILGHFAQTELPGLSEAELDLYEALLGENDHDLYGWLSGQAEPPADHKVMLQRLSKVLSQVSADN